MESLQNCTRNAASMHHGMMQERLEDLNSDKENLVQQRAGLQSVVTNATQEVC